MGHFSVSADITLLGGIFMSSNFGGGTDGTGGGGTDDFG